MNKNSGILNLELNHLDQSDNVGNDSVKKDDLFIYNNTSQMRNVQIRIRSILSYIFRIKSQHILVSMSLILIYLCYFISSPPLNPSSLLTGNERDWIFQDLNNQNWNLTMTENQVAIFQRPIDSLSDLLVFQKIEKEVAFGKNNKQFTISCIQKKSAEISCWQSEVQDLMKPLNMLSVLKSSSNPMFWKSRKIEDLGDAIKIDYSHMITLMKDKGTDGLIGAKFSGGKMMITRAMKSISLVLEKDMRNIEKSLNDRKLSPLLGLATTQQQNNTNSLPEIYNIKLECNKFIFWTYCEPSIQQ